MISGPSGVGKNTLASRVSQDGFAVRAVTATTREPRLGEKDGVDYYFLSEDEFLAWRDEGRLLEWNHYGGNWYGTPLFAVNNACSSGKAVLLVIDVNGALKIKEKEKRVNLIFVLPPSMQALEDRLHGRGKDDEQSIRQRLDTAEKEVAQKDSYDHQIINEDVASAVEGIKKIIAAKTGRGEK